LWLLALLRARGRRSSEDHPRDGETYDDFPHDQTFRVRCSAIE
jgi:hypothetical protein